jgi:hypothetical protein
MRVTEDRSPPLALSGDTPFGAIIGTLVGVFIGGSLWALLAFAILLLRRL